ncbi:MAG: 50S ribosomal protein L13 [Chloroflexi bacterium]|nr:50S ribosomal protein L13 [Chloroflexota bacterium]
MIQQKTYVVKKADIQRDWYVIDATDLVLGRLATRVATVLRGKHKQLFTPSVDLGDHVIVLNADKIRVTGRKLEQKMYRRHSGYPGGLKETNLKTMLATKPERVIELAVRRMLPKNALGAVLYRRLHVYTGDQHEHTAQQPKELKLDERMLAP